MLVHPANCRVTKIELSSLEGSISGVHFGNLAALHGLRKPQNRELAGGNGLDEQDVVGFGPGAAYRLNVDGSKVNILVDVDWALSPELQGDGGEVLDRCGHNDTPNSAIARVENMVESLF